MLADGEVCGEVPHRVRVDVGPWGALVFREVVEEAAGPVDVGALGSRGIVPGSEALAELVEGGERADVPVLVDDGACGRAVPVGPVEEVDEVHPERVLGLTTLPVLTPAPLEVFAETAYLVGQGPVGGGALQEAANPADAVGRSGLPG
jgi:hypothetical protein